MLKVPRSNEIISSLSREISQKLLIELAISIPIRLVFFFMEKDLKELVDTYIQTNSVKLVQKAVETPKQAKNPKKKAEKKVSEPKPEGPKLEKKTAENTSKETPKETTAAV